jgi:uroporphyrinogen decarboxylase
VDLPLKRPRPDVDQFVAVITGRKPPERVHFAELFLDNETMQAISEKYLGRAWVTPDLADRATFLPYFDNVIECWYQLGYDYVWAGGWQEILFQGKYRQGTDTAERAKSTRIWMEESEGIIGSWEDFEAYPWPDPERVSLAAYEYASGRLPDGMGLLVCFGQGTLENVMNVLVGLEPLSYMLYEQPDLVEAIFEKVGRTLYRLSERVIGLPRLTGFFQGDDMGYQSSTLISPDHIRKYVLPWHKKIARLAHDNGLLYVLHSCGNVGAIMDDLIDDVGIDAKHSFQDKILPVGEFKRKYGDRIGVLGGVDVDKMCRLPEEEIRAYVRGILEECVPGGRYALGSGNSVANYIPIENYLAMLDEGVRWTS